MRYDDVRNGVWYIQTEAREKGEELRLPSMALETIEAQKLICPGPRVFDCPVTRLRSLKFKFDHRHTMRVRKPGGCRRKPGSNVGLFLLSQPGPRLNAGPNVRLWHLGT